MKGIITESSFHLKTTPYVGAASLLIGHMLIKDLMTGKVIPGLRLWKLQLFPYKREMWVFFSTSWSFCES